MLFRRDFNSGQFQELKKHYQEAGEALGQLKQNYPEYADIWKIVHQKMDVIKKTIEEDEIPSDEMKRSADITTMLTYELRDFNDKQNNLAALYKLDNAYTLLGMKDIHFEFETNNNKLK